MSVNLKSCGACKFYSPLKGEPPAGYCEFLENPTIPFWLETHISELRNLSGSDVVPTDGANCDAFEKGRP